MSPGNPVTEDDLAIHKVHSLDQQSPKKYCPCISFRSRFPVLEFFFFFVHVWEAMREKELNKRNRKKKEVEQDWGEKNKSRVGLRSEFPGIPGTQVHAHNTRIYAGVPAGQVPVLVYFALVRYTTLRHLLNLFRFSFTSFSFIILLLLLLLFIFFISLVRFAVRNQMGSGLGSVPSFYFERANVYTFKRVEPVDLPVWLPGHRHALWRTRFRRNLF